jgi:Spy/CpxP family protein refolding chaperone
MKQLVALLALALMPPAFAQTHTHPADSKSPYSDMTERDIKALSDEQISDLRAGRGMSLALPAELNGYPGPRHALDLAEALELTPAQRAHVQALFGEMQREAAALGSRIIESERALDRSFATRTVTEEKLNAALAEIATQQGKLRAAHLKYHLRTRDLLTETQVTRYDELRGYKAVQP